jgi:hypothetical protein
MFLLKIISTSLLCFSLSSARAQLEVMDTGGWTTIGALKTFGAVKAKMEYRAAGSDTTYLLFMKDFTKRDKNAESNFFSVRFRNTGDAFNKLYVLLQSFFLEENRGNSYTKTFKLGSDMVNLQHNALITGKGVRLTTKEGYINFSERDIDKLFGKR